MTLKSHPSIKKVGSAQDKSSFRFQATPCVQLPVNNASFEFASSFWEDRKPVHQTIEDAYRQNRMSTTSAARHLHSLRIEAPVFGLLWSNGEVRAHADWWKCEEAGKAPVSMLIIS